MSILLTQEGEKASVRAYLPENLDLRDHLEPKWQDYGKWVVGGLYLRHHIEKQVERDDFRPTHSKVLKQVLPKREYRHILDCLLDGGVIEQDGEYAYRAGGRSKAYRLVEKYRLAKFRAEHLHHRELVRKARAYHEWKKSLVNADVHLHLRDNLSRLAVRDGFPAESLPLTCIRDGESNFTVCKLGRVHTPLTNLNREHRRFVHCDSKPLWMVDVSNSQPLLMALTLSADGELPYSEYKAYEKWLKDRRTLWLKTKTTKIPYLPPHSPSQSHLSPYVGTYKVSSSDSLSVMRAQCLAGVFNEVLMARVLADPLRDHSVEWTRQKIKEEFWVSVYDNPSKTIRWSTVARAFYALHPGVWRAVDGFYRAHDHGELPRRMQTVESYLCVWRTCTRIMRERPTAPLFTLHDCLVSDEQNIELYAGILREEYKAVFGVEPKLSVKPFC